MQQMDYKTKEYIKRILLSRLRILNKHGFYGSLLMHLKFGISNMTDTAFTNGYKICFNPNFLDELNDSELDFILMHEILHIVLKHCFRGHKYDNSDLFNIACDVVVNSTILKSNDMLNKSITLKKYGRAIHVTPRGDEGYLYTAEEVYQMLLNTPLAKSNNKQELEDAWNNLRGKDDESDNNVLKGSSNKKGSNKGKSNNKDNSEEIIRLTIDDHDKWNEELVGSNDGYVDEWDLRLMNAIESEKQKESVLGVGDIPLGALRIYNELKESKVNWRMLLNDFLHTEINDYSFTPPDRRMEGDFFMPDFNEEEEKFREINVFIAVDTSGSISTNDLTRALSEIKGAFETTDNNIKGWLAYFDATLYDLQPFDSIDDILKSRISGGGGTSFHVIFEGLKEFERKVGDKPDMIIIFTDGYAEYPKESIREDIPVLWLINNNKITPPWGVIARFE